MPDEETLLREYYAARESDPVTGKPSRQKLEALGPAEVAGDLWAE